VRTFKSWCLCLGVLLAFDALARHVGMGFWPQVATGALLVCGWPWPAREKRS
jgi:hypothetical protein